MLQTGTAPTAAGVIRVRKRLEEEAAEAVVPRATEHVQVDHVEAEEADSGLVETLPDGSVSIPVFEERLVIQKKLVVRERIIVRKVRVTEERQVNATIRRERVEIDADPQVESRVQDVPSALAPGDAAAPPSTSVRTAENKPSSTPTTERAAPAT